MRFSEKQVKELKKAVGEEVTIVSHYNNGSSSVVIVPEAVQVNINSAMYFAKGLGYNKINPEGLEEFESGNVINVYKLNFDRVKDEETGGYVLRMVK